METTSEGSSPVNEKSFDFFLSLALSELALCDDVMTGEAEPATPISHVSTMTGAIGASELLRRADFCDAAAAAAAVVVLL